MINSYNSFISQPTGCADPVFPGMYSRISNKYQWIRDLVCAWAEKPPASYGCVSKPERPKKTERPVTVEIRLDRFPKETGWLIRSEYGKTNSYIAIGTYSDYTGKSTKDKTVATIVQLEEDTKYELIMLDAYGDGLKFDGGYYKLWLGNAPFMGIQLDSGSTYGKYIKHPFYVPKNVATKQPTPAPNLPPQDSPAESPAPDPTPLAPKDEPYLTIGFKFDQYPEQTGWAITSVETQELLTSKPFGSYNGKKNSMIFEKFMLPENSGNASDQYIFAILDSGRDGMCCDKGQGFFQVFYGGIADNKVMFRGGSFTYLQQFIFQLDGSVITSPPVYSPQRLDGDNQNPTDQRFPWNDDTTSGGINISRHHNPWVSITIGMAIIVVCVF